MRNILSLIFAIFTTISFAQSLHFEAISNTFELPSKECYNILQDSKGYIWWSSEQGLCRYNGAKITVFNRSNGFDDKASYALVEDSQKRLWIYGANHNIYYYQNGKIKKAPFSDIIKNKTSSFEIPYNLDVIHEGKTLLINTNKSTFEVDLKTYKVVVVPTNSYKHLLAFQNFGDRITLRSSFSNALTSHGLRTIGLFNAKNRAVKTIHLGKMGQELIYSRPVVAKKGKRTFLAVDTYIFIIEGNSVLDIKKLPQKILSLYIDQDDNFIVGMRKKGMLRYRNSNLNSAPTTALPNLSISGIYVDRDKKIWCTTLEKGVFLCRNAFLKIISDNKESSQTYELLKTVDNRLFTANDPKYIVEVNDSQRTLYKVPGHFSEMFRDITNFRFEWYVASHQYIARTDSKFSRLNLLKGNSKSNQNALSFHKVNNQLYYLSIRYLGKISGIKLDTVVAFPFKVRSGCHISGNKWLLATSDALCLLDSKSKEISEISRIPDPVNCIYADAKKRFWIATKGSGLYKFQNGKLSKFIRSGLEDAVYISDIKQHPDGKLWLSTNTGIYRFDPDSQESSVEKIAKDQGFISNEIYSTACINGTYYAATADGLCSFTTQIFKTNKAKPLLYFSEVFIDGKKVNLNSIQKEIPHGTSNLLFKFDIVDYQNRSRVLHYELSGTQSKSRTTFADYVSLDNLKPGKYQLKVWIPATRNKRSSEVITFDFVIEKPFWQYSEFFVFFVMLCLVAIGLIFRFLLNHYKKKEREKTQIHKLIIESKLAAMQAQMNPHFIFNAINGIQNYVLNNESELAYDYLTQFSRLIRKVLQNSQSRLLPLSEELETLKLYVSLEQLRFEQAFEYEVIIDSVIDGFQTYLPPMLIQPYIENAIWHGIMAKPKQFKGLIRVEFLAFGEQLIIKISDNGIGRKAAQQFKNNSSHQSLGMSISYARLEMVQRLYQVKAISIEVTDLEENGQISGTLVEIRLPINLTNDS